MTQILAQLPTVWRQAPRRWGHELHSLCSYMAMFPPALPRVFIEWLSEPGDVVYDPFSGRGTTILESLLSGRVALGSDANPLAWILSSAKATPPTKRAVERRLAALCALGKEADLDQVPSEIRMLFSRGTLRQLMWLRGELCTKSPVDRFLLAVLMGSLHANADSDGRPRGLTVAMPNTFAMAPGYVSKYIVEHGLRPPKVNVLSFLAERADRFRLPWSGSRLNRAWIHDVRRPIPWPHGLPLAKLIFTSPPYLGVMRYAKLNWIRHWLIRTDHRQIDGSLFSSGAIQKYLLFIRETLVQCRSVLRDDGVVCLVIGDVRRGNANIRLGEVVANECTSATDLRLVGIIEDHLPVKHKVSRIWGSKKGRATKTDRILVLAGPRARIPRQLPMLNWAACNGAIR